MKCSGCDLEYPAEILDTLVADGKRIPDVCSLCAAEVMYGWKGSSTCPFSGERNTQNFAIAFKLRGKEWRPAEA